MGGHHIITLHLPQNGENDEASEEAGETVDGGGDEGISVAVVVELVVAGQRQQGAEPRTQREEDLRGGVYPHLGIER